MTVIKDKRRVPFETPFHKCKTPSEHLTELRDHLQTALELEHATIPPYLCALYSIKDNTNGAATHRIRSVVLEEMLHMVLVANLLNAIGGKPSIARKDFVKPYPTALPRSDEHFKVQLNKFSTEAIENFLEIERPRDPAEPPIDEDYSSIGQFYAAIKDELDYFCHEFGEKALFVKKSPQVSPLDYYSGGGEVVQVTNYESARLALKVIVDEGEGFGHSIFSGDNENFGERLDLAHFYKFNEIAVGRTYLPSDSPAHKPSGPPLAVDFSEDSVYPAKFFETGKDSSEEAVKKYPKVVRPSLFKFNRTYSRLLRAIDDGFNGKQKRLKGAATLMFEIKYQMIALMKIPIDKQGNTAGPTFFYIDE